MPDYLQFIDFNIPPCIVIVFKVSNILSKFELKCIKKHPTFKTESLVIDVTDIDFIYPPLLKLSCVFMTHMQNAIFFTVIKCKG